MPTKHHRGFSQWEVDQMDLTVCAVMLGRGTDPMAEQFSELAELTRRRQAGEDVSWGDT